jgi:tetratricopeptide (TPR) repeat protein
MPHSFCLRLLPVILWLLSVPTPAAAQGMDAPSLIQEVDPSPEPPPEEESDDSVYEDEERSQVRRPGKPKRPAAEDVPLDEPPERGPTPSIAPPATAAPTAPKPPAPKVEAPARTPPPPLLAPRVSDADLLAVWERWVQARSAKDTAAADQARKDLTKLRDEVGATDFDTFSASLLRESQSRLQAKDMTSAVHFAEDAASLSPNLPYARFVLADAYARRDPGAVGKYVGEFQSALAAVVRDPRYLRPAVANTVATALLALLATAVAVVGVLFLRRIRYFLHDIHHVFPRGVGRWQSIMVVIAILLMPLLLRLGVVPVLVVLFGMVVLYLNAAERTVAAVLLALVGLIPLIAGQVARATTFAGTVAEDVYLLERGGFAADDAASRILVRQEAKEATFAELFALGRYESRRGLLEEATTHFKAAAALRQRHALLLTNFGNALLASGDVDGATRLYQEAAQADSSLAAAPYNLAQIYRRRARELPDDKVGAELQRASETMAVAQRLDASLVGRDVPPDDRLLANQLLLSPALPVADMLALADGSAAGKRVESQLDRLLLGVSGPVARFYPLVLAGLLFLWGSARDRLRASKGCEKCGRTVCRRCDPDLGMGSFLCSQCTNVFARKGVVPEPMRARKQAEVQRHQNWLGRISLALGALVSGAGHVFAGLPVRGAIYCFLFLLAVAVMLMSQGVLRVPYGEAPSYLKMAPAALVLLPLYLLSLRGLFKRRTQ